MFGFMVTTHLFFVEIGMVYHWPAYSGRGLKLDFSFLLLDSDSVPQASKTEGAGSLFTKPDSEDKTEEKEESKDSKPKNISLR